MYTCKFCGREFEKNFAHTQHEKYYCKLNPNRQESKSRITYTQHHKAKCKYCGKEVDVAGIKLHMVSCQNPNSKLNIKKQQTHVTHEGLNCIYCGKECKHLNSLAQHEIRCPKNPNRKDYCHLSDYVVSNLAGKTKETSEVLQHISESLKQNYACGKMTPIESFPFVTDDSDYLFLNHNVTELTKWFNFLDGGNFDIPPYEVLTYEDNYAIIKGSYVRENNSVKFQYEHNFLMNEILPDGLDKNNCVHHLNRDKTDNSLHNLIVFDTQTSHHRYHTSKRAYLTYDENTHLFHCELKDMC